MTGCYCPVRRGGHNAKPALKQPCRCRPGNFGGRIRQAGIHYPARQVLPNRQLPPALPGFSQSWASIHRGCRPFRGSLGVRFHPIRSRICHARSASPMFSRTCRTRGSCSVTRDARSTLHSRTPSRRFEQMNDARRTSHQARLTIHALQCTSHAPCTTLRAACCVHHMNFQQVIGMMK